MRVRLRNRTHFRGDDLRRFFMAGIRAYGADRDEWTIHVVYGKSPAWGCAYVNSAWVKMSLPKDREKHDLQKFAQVFMHELDHCRGLRHKDMANWWEFDAAWAEGLEIRVKEPRRPPSPIDRLRKQVTHAQGMLRRHRTRLKRQQTLTLKWEKKAVRLERRERAMLPPPGNNVEG